MSSGHRLEERRFVGGIDHVLTIATVREDIRFAPEFRCDQEVGVGAQAEGGSRVPKANAHILGTALNPAPDQDVDL